MIRPLLLLALLFSRSELVVSTFPPTSSPSNPPIASPTPTPTQIPSKLPTPQPSNPPVASPTVLPTTTSQLSPSTSVNSQTTSPTSTALATDSGLYSTDFSFRRLTESSSVDSEFTFDDFKKFTRVQGAPAISYAAVSIDDSGENWVALSTEGVTYISTDSGINWSQGTTIPGAKKVIFNALGEVVTFATPVFYNGTANGTTGVTISLVPEDLLFTPAPTARPTHVPLDLGCYPYERK